MDFLQLILLGAIQGLTEFLPVSSSAHLILLPRFTGQNDQGLAIDVAAHCGTLMASVIYFRHSIKNILQNGLKSISRGNDHADARLLLLILISAVPISLTALLAHDLIATSFRSPLVIATATIVFGLLLWCADATCERNRNAETLSWKDIICLTLAQILALIPGTSRSGITMTTALMLGLDRRTSAYLSFLMSIPVILLAGAYETALLLKTAGDIDKSSFIIIFLVSFSVATLTIRFFLKYIEKTGMLPYVIYRILLGGILLYCFL